MSEKSMPSTSTILWTVGISLLTIALVEGDVMGLGMVKDLLKPSPKKAA